MPGNLLRQLIERMINQGDFTAVDELVHPAFRDLDMLPGEPEGTREGLKAIFAEMRKSFPDLHFEPLQEEDVVGDHIWGRYMASGTMTGGPFFDQPATGRSARWREIHWVRVDEETGLIIEHFGAGDDLGMLRGLGLQAPLPPIPAAGQENNPDAR